MQPYIPDDPNPKHLQEEIQPRGWENLGGPMKWVEFRSSSVQKNGELYDEHGPYVFTETVGEVGKLVDAFCKTEAFGRKAFMFGGPPGIGKTALIRLMALTWLADEHEPVTYTSNAGTEVTFIDKDTREPYDINPVESGFATYKTIQKSLSETGSTANNVIESHNAGRMKKPDIDELATSINRPLALTGGKRVIVINELDQVSAQQIPSLKSALDPSGAIPDGLLVLTDTNHIDRISFDEAGKQRFKQIQFNTWPMQSLETYADKYLDGFGVEFDEGARFESDPIQQIADKARGSIRGLIDIVEPLVKASGPIDAPKLQDALGQSTAGGTSKRSSQMKFRFVNRVVRGSRTAASFTQEAIQKGTNIVSFANELSEWLLDKHPTVFEVVEVADAIHRIRDAVQHTAGRPATAIRWAAITEPLMIIADYVRQGPSDPPASNGKADRPVGGRAPTDKISG